MVRIITESAPRTRVTSSRRVSDDDYSVRRAAGQRILSDTVRALNSRRSAPIVQLHGFNVHQLYGCCHPDNSASLCRDLSICVEDVARLMCSYCLQLNARKTEFMGCVPSCRRHQLPVDQLTIQSTSVASRESVRDLGVYLDRDMSMHKHVAQLVCSCYGILRQLRSIRRSLPRTALATLVTSFIMSKVDYCNVVLAAFTT